MKVTSSHEPTLLDSFDPYFINLGRSTKIKAVCFEPFRGTEASGTSDSYSQKKFLPARIYQSWKIRCIFNGRSAKFL